MKTINIIRQYGMMDDMLDAPVRDSTAEVAEGSDSISAAYNNGFLSWQVQHFNLGQKKKNL